VDHRTVAYALGRLTSITGLMLLVPTILAMWDHRGVDPFLHFEVIAFAATAVVCLILGRVLANQGSEEDLDPGIREGFAIVTFGWLLLALLGSIPLLVWFLHPEGGARGAEPFAAFTDAFFEIMSGFTTTGSTILFDIEALPRPLLLWRSLTHWLGGMGIITLALAVFPAIGVGGYQMFRGEVPGPATERLRPRLAETAKILWGVYAVLTAAEAGLLALAGMDAFDALNHAFATIATGGFSTRNGSIGAYQSPTIEWIVIVFMFLAGTNFLLHYRLLFFRDLNGYLKNREFHVFFALVVVAAGVLAAGMALQGVSAPETGAGSWQVEPMAPRAFEAHLVAEDARFDSAEGAIRTALFQTLAIVTGTGFGTADFDVWPHAARFLLVLLMFGGACAGSTSGGLKLYRIILIWKVLVRNVRKSFRPHLVAPLKMNRQTVDEDVASHAVGFALLFLTIFAVATLAMTCFVDDLTTAATSVVATLANIGPALSGVGPTQSFGWMPSEAKWVLSLCMLLGRLEIYTVLALFSRSFWSR